MNKIKLSFTFVMYIFIVSFQTSLAQHFEYTYDAGGNRIQRTYHSLRLGGTPPDTVKLKDSLSGHAINVYPNPTTGALVVNIDDFSTVSKSKIEIYDMAGRQVFKKETLNEFTNIDLTKEKNGDYFLRILVDDKIKEWKVVKAE